MMGGVMGKDVHLVGTYGVHITLETSVFLSWPWSWLVQVCYGLAAQVLLVN